MRRNRLAVFALAAVLGVAAGTALAQKQGGTLQVYHRDSPASMSIHEEATWSTIMPMMGVFNNLVLYDQHIKQNTLATIRPELATSWNWNEDGTELTFKLRRDVKWHDGKPFTAADVKCTWDMLLGRGKEKLRLNPRETWYLNLADITELWRRGSVVASWLLDLTAAALAASPELEEFAGRVSDSGEGRWTALAAIDEGVPTPILTTALYERFSSRGEADFADKLLSAMRFEFGGHVEKEAGH